MWPIKEENNYAENNGLNNGVIANCIKDSVVEVYNYDREKRMPSIINRLIEVLANFEDSGEYEEQYNRRFKAYDIPEKIEYNAVVKYEDFINENAKYYYGACDKALNIIDNNRFNSKKKILRNIHDLYSLYCGELRKNNPTKNKIDLIRENADCIIDYMKNKIERDIRNSFENESFFEEDISLGLNIIICYAFVDCKILEEPR